MKILITTDAYNNIVNGVAISVNQLYNGLTAMGHEVRILTLSDTKTSYKEGPVYFIKSVPIKIYPDARATVSFHTPLMKDIIQWQPNIIHSQCEFFSFIFAKKLSNYLHIPIVHTYHTLYEYYTHYFCPNKAIGRKIVSIGSRFVLGQTHAVIAPTGKTKRFLQNYGVNTPITIIPTGLDFDNLKKPISETEKSELKASLNIPENAPVLLTLGRVAKEKNMDFLLRQLASPKLREHNCHLVIAGEGPERQNLQEIADSLGISPYVHFTGLIKPEHVYKYYNIGDMFVSASKSETQGLTYIEALVCGLPLLCYKDDCLTSVLNHGENGYFYETDTELVEHIAYLCNHKDVLKNMRQNALDSSLNFSKEVFALRALKLYKETILQYNAVPAISFLAPLLNVVHPQKEGK